MKDILPLQQVQRNRSAAPNTSKHKSAMIWIAKRKVILELGVRLFLRLASWSYYGALQYYTLDPISEIQECQNCKDRLPQKLYEFRSRKDEEIRFVRNAATLSAAAAIGIFSWPSVDNSFWLAKMFWHWSLISSFFSLISSVQQRLLREFPTELPTAVPEEVDFEKEMQAPLGLVLSLTRLDAKGFRKSSFKMIWVWQSSTMLMSYAWLLFFLGYMLHILSPVFERLEGDWSRMTIPMASVTVGISLIVFLNFLFCALASRQRLILVRKVKERCSKSSPSSSAYDP